MVWFLLGVLIFGMLVTLIQISRLNLSFRTETYMLLLTKHVKHPNIKISENSFPPTNPHLFLQHSQYHHPAVVLGTNFGYIFESSLMSHIFSNHYPNTHRTLLHSDESVQVRPPSLLLLDNGIISQLTPCPQEHKLKSILFAYSGKMPGILIIICTYSSCLKFACLCK